MAVSERSVDAALPDSGELSRQFVRSVHDRFDTALRHFLMNRLRCFADAEDMAQEVYLRFLRLDNPRKIRSDRAFLYATANNLIRDRSRRLVTRLEKASVCTDDVALECTSDDPAQRAHDADQVRLVAEALDQICERSRTAFYMSRIEGKSYAEIAEVMGVSVSMIEKHVSAALARLREIID